MDTHIYSVANIVQREGYVILTDIQPFKIVTQRSIINTGHILLGDCIDHLPSVRQNTSLRTVISLMNRYFTNVLPVYNNNKFTGVVLRKDVTQALYDTNLKITDIVKQSKNDLLNLSQIVHNNIGQYLSALSLKCAELAEKAKLQMNINYEDVNKIHDLCISAGESLHEFTQSILCKENDNLSDHDIIISLCQKIESLFDFSVKTDIIGMCLPISTSDRKHSIMFIQEALTNAAKHSGKNSATLKIRCNSSHLIYFISDNGCGFDISTLKKGLGLKLMDFNANELSAQFIIKSNNRGTSVTLKLPLSKHSYCQLNKDACKNKTQNFDC